MASTISKHRESPTKDKLKATTFATSILLLALTIYAGSASGGIRADRTFSGLHATLIDTSLGYDYNHTAGFTLNATISNNGPLDVSIKDIRATTMIHGKPVYVKSLETITIGAGESKTLAVTDDMLRVPDLDEAIYRDLKAGGLQINVAFTGDAIAGEASRNVTISGNTTTGFIHPPGTGLPHDSTVKGPLNQNVDCSYITYVNLSGKLAPTKFLPSLDYTGTIYNDTVEALTLVTDGAYPQRYVVLTQTYRPVAYDSTDYSELKPLDKVYMTGMMFHYEGWNGEQYLAVVPIDASSSKLSDYVELARGKLISRLGEVNYDRSFFAPLVIRYMDNDLGVATKYEVEYQYPAWDGFTMTIFRVSVSFYPNGTLAESFGVPPIDNLSPYRVNIPEAKALAVKADLPSGPYPLECSMIYYQKDTGANAPVWGDRYLYRVASWIDPPDSNPRMMNLAIVDPVTGKVYSIGESGIGYIVSYVGTP